MEPATSIRDRVPTLEGFADADMKKRGSALEFGCEAPTPEGTR